ncbi:MAG: cation-translocating P-type ATPase [Methanosarcinaceae archaeon]|nr:cation-translocating P-type ATPase [Methanosarcinaceae archaeon]
MDYDELNIDDVFVALETSKEGLAPEDATKRLEKYGTNELEEKQKITPLKVLLNQFGDFIVWILFAAAMISLAIGETINFGVISSIIAFVIILGFIQEYKAEKAMEALKRIVEPTTRVLRNGRRKEILTKDVVPGDVLLLETGDSIPADAKIFDITGLKVDESALTGESGSVEKKEGDMVFAGTQIVHGKCKAMVTSTGMQTKLGQIAGMIQEVEEKTPLQIKITDLSKSLAMLALTACTITFALGILKGAPLGEMLIIALALAVAAVPVGLPFTLTLTLAYGMRKMAKQNALIRKMLGVETLGSTTVICTDKTGTLTKNEMTVEKIYVDETFFDITGVGYEPNGDYSIDGTKIDVTKHENLGLLLKAATLCNNAGFEENVVNIKSRDKWKLIGDPTEISLVVAAAKADIWQDDLENDYQMIEEILFTSERKLMSTVHENYGVGDKCKTVFSKGAPEFLLKKCSFIRKRNGVEELTKDEVARILKTNHKLASSAYRVLGVAHKEMTEPLTPENIEKDLVFLGLIAMIDPAREEAKKAILTCKKAGIKVVMITGDNDATAKAIAQKIGLFDEITDFVNITDEKLKGIVADGVITGSELESLDEEEFESVVEGISIYARMMPQQKVRIVKALQKKGHIVAMTGDGVNDAPALKKADIGIAMGIKGTDVAKESSTMVLQDDNFATIVEAVKQGRAIYSNIEKFTCYLISRNFTEVILIMTGIILLGFDFLPLLALQILFINMFDEIMPAIGLGLDPASDGIMSRKPRDPYEKILKKRNLIIILSIAFAMGMAAFMVFLTNNPTNEIEKARTLTFATIVSMILFIPFAFRSLEESIFKIGFFTNKLLVGGVFGTFLLTLGVMYIPFFRDIFELTPLTAMDWIIPLSVAFAAMIFAEVIKAATKGIK